MPDNFQTGNRISTRPIGKARARKTAISISLMQLRPSSYIVLHAADRGDIEPHLMENVTTEDDFGLHAYDSYGIGTVMARLCG